MGEYINKLEVIELADDILHIVDELRSCSQIDYHAYSELFDNLSGFDTIPAADVAPVVHGKWIVVQTFDDCVYAKCSNCDVTQIFYHNKPLTKFCPDCGAKMDL